MSQENDDKKMSEMFGATIDKVDAQKAMEMLAKSTEAFMKKDIDTVTAALTSEEEELLKQFENERKSKIKKIVDSVKPEIKAVKNPEIKPEIKPEAKAQSMTAEERKQEGISSEEEELLKQFEEERRRKKEASRQKAPPPPVVEVPAAKHEAPLIMEKEKSEEGEHMMEMFGDEIEADAIGQALEKEVLRERDKIYEEEKHKIEEEQRTERISEKKAKLMKIAGDKEALLEMYRKEMGEEEKKEEEKKAEALKEEAKSEAPAAAPPVDMAELKRQIENEMRERVVQEMKKKIEEETREQLREEIKKEMLDEKEKKKQELMKKIDGMKVNMPAPAASAPAPVKKAEDLQPVHTEKIESTYEEKMLLLKAFEQSQKILGELLGNIIKKKPVETMYLRTLQETIPRHRDVLGKSDMNKENKVRTDGTLETARIMANINGMSGNDTFKTKKFMEGLQSLFDERLVATEIAVGIQLKDEILSNVLRQTERILKEKGYTANVRNLFWEYIVPSTSMKPGEE